MLRRLYAAIFLSYDARCLVPLTEYFRAQHMPSARLVQVKAVVRRTAILTSAVMAVAVMGGRRVGGSRRGKARGSRGGEATRKRRELGGGEGWIDKRGVARLVESRL